MIHCIIFDDGLLRFSNNCIIFDKLNSFITFYCFWQCLCLLVSRWFKMVARSGEFRFQHCVDSITGITWHPLGIFTLCLVLNAGMEWQLCKWNNKCWRLMQHHCEVQLAPAWMISVVFMIEIARIKQFRILLRIHI